MENNYPKSWNESKKPHLFCPGCGHGIALKQLGFAIDELEISRNIVFGIDIGCSLLAWDFFNFDTIQTHHGRTTPVMTGYKIADPKKTVIAYMGDGAGYAIGLQSIIHTALRNNPVTVILVNNGNYAMTGGQMSPTTQIGEITTTSPDGKAEKFGNPIMGPEFLSSIQIKNTKQYIARATVERPLELRNCIKKAIKNQIENNAFSFVEILSICPTNWKMNAAACFDKVSKLKSYYKTGEFCYHDK